MFYNYQKRIQKYSIKTIKKFVETIEINLWRTKVKLHQRFNAKSRSAIWLIGSGRSGTTWISEIINYDGVYREIFEPFHPSRVKYAKFLRMHECVLPGSSHEKLDSYSRKVFAGVIFNKNVDLVRSRIDHEGILVKDIFANLFAVWLMERNPFLRVIYLIRNPFAVALSTYKAKSWIWMINPNELLDQCVLYKSYLSGYEKIVSDTIQDNDYILNQILIWCIVNGVALNQLKNTQAKIVFYENLYLNIFDEARDIIKFARDDDISKDAEFDISVLTKPSKMSNNKVIKNNAEVLDQSWVKELSDEQVNKGYKILEFFGFENFYDENGYPYVEKFMNYQWHIKA